MTMQFLILETLTFVTLLLTMACILRARKREAEQFKPVLNITLFGLFIFLITTFIASAITLRETYRILILPAPVLTTLQPLYAPILYPLFAISIFVGILLINKKI